MTETRKHNERLVRDYFRCIYGVRFFCNPKYKDLYNRTIAIIHKERSDRNRKLSGCGDNLIQRTVRNLRGYRKEEIKNPERNLSAIYLPKGDGSHITKPHLPFERED